MAVTRGCLRTAPVIGEFVGTNPKTSNHPKYTCTGQKLQTNHAKLRILVQIAFLSLNRIFLVSSASTVQ